MKHSPKARDGIKALGIWASFALLLPFLFCLLATGLVAHDWKAEAEIHRDTAILSHIFAGVAGILKDFGVPEGGFSFTQSLKSMLFTLPIVILVVGLAVRDWLRGRPSAENREVFRLISNLDAPEWKFWKDKNAALESLAAIGSGARPALEAIVRLLTNGKTVEIRGSAALALGRIFSDIGPLVAVDEESWPAVHKQMEKLMMLREMPNLPRDEAASSAVQALLRALDDSEKPVIATAAKVLAWFGPRAKSATPRLQALAENPNAMVSLASKTALANISGEGKQFVEELCASMLDKKCDEEKRSEAAGAVLNLWWVDLSTATPELIKAAALLKPGVSGLVFATLGCVLSSANESRETSHVESATHHAFRALQVGSIAQYAQGMLVSVGPVSVPAMRDHLRSTSDPDVLVRLVKVLEGIGPEARDALPELIALPAKLRDNFGDADDYVSSVIAKIREEQK